MGPFDNLPSSGNSVDDQSQSPQTDPMSRVLSSMQNFSQGSSAASGMVNLGLSLFGQNAGTAQDTAVGQGMDELSKLMAQNGNDPSRAMVQFMQNPVAHKIMAVPGAFQKLIAEFQKGVKEPNPLESAGITQGAGGIVQRGPNTLMTQTQNPQPTTTGPGNHTQFYQNGQPVPNGTVNQPTSDFQTFKSFADQFGAAFDKNTINTMAMMNASNNDPGKRLALGQNLLNQGADAKLVNAWVIGQYSVQTFPEYPGVAILQDNFNMNNRTFIPWNGTPAPGSVPALGTTGASAPQQQQQPTAVQTTPQGANAGGTNPLPIPSQNGVPQQQTFQQPAAAVPGAPTQPSYAQPAADPNDPKTQQISTKYNAAPGSVEQSGMINPVKAWGPGALLPLTSGLPAIIQADAATVSQWFNPGDTSAITEVAQKGKAMQDGLKYLLTSDMQNGRLKTVIDNVEALGTEHEKDSSPQYAIDQLLNLRHVLGMQQNTYTGFLSRMAPSDKLGPDRLPFDKDEIMKVNTGLMHIKNILDFVPSEAALNGMKQAIIDGRISNVPSFGTAAKQVIDTGKRALSSGVGAVTGNISSLDAANNDPGGAIKQISNMNVKQLMNVIKLQSAANTPGTALLPAIQQAITKRFEQLRAQAKGANAPAPSPNAPAAMPYSPEQPPQGGSVKDFTNNPMRTAANPFEQIKQQARTQRSQMPFGGKNPTPAQRVRGGFSMFGM